MVYVKKYLKRLLADSGQGVVEYILILIIAVGVILGALYQMNSAFRSWSDNYFGDYLTCLLETGELPALGGDSGQSGTCGSNYKEFSIAEGRPLIGSAISGDEGGGADGGGGSSADSSSGSSESYAGAGGGTTVQRISNSSFVSSPKRYRVRSRGAGAGGAGAGGDGEATNTGSTTVTALSGYESGKSIRIPIRRSEGYSGGRRGEEDKKEDGKIAGAATANNAAERKGPVLIRIDRKVASEMKEVDIEEFTFGKFFRYLIIAAIVIAIVLFIGGQMLQVSKSME
jgi:hypothetical protein